MASTTTSVPSWRTAQWNRGPADGLPRLPAQPLIDWLGEHPGRQLEAAGYDRTALHRWAERGLLEQTADHVACRLGVHPAVIWGWWWWATSTETDIETGGRFCGRHPQEAHGDHR